MKTQPDCLSDGALARLLAGDVEPAERAAAEEHLSRCAVCRERLAVAIEARRPQVHEEVPEEMRRQVKALVPETPVSDTPVPEARRSGTSRRTWLPLAAVLALAAGLAAIWPVGPGVEEPSDTLRDGRATSLELFQPEIDAGAGASVIFSWRPLAAARRYDLELLDEIGDVIYEASTNEARVEVAREHLALAPGGVYYWSVRALLGDGTLLESEPLPVSF